MIHGAQNVLIGMASLVTRHQSSAVQNGGHSCADVG